jgi:uncharacterized protein YqfA (UPF0365 family)
MNNDYSPRKKTPRRVAKRKKMKIGLMEEIFMRFRKSPVGKFKRILKIAEENQIEMNVQQLEVHHLAGGDGEKIIEALVLAKDNGITLDHMKASAIDLAGKDLVQVVMNCIEEHEFVFDTYSKDSDERMRGICKDGTEAYARCRIKYRLPVDHIWADKIPLVQEHLSARIAVLINTEESPRKLEFMKDNYKPSLLKLAKDKMETIKGLEIEFGSKKF